MFNTISDGTNKNNAMGSPVLKRREPAHNCGKRPRGMWPHVCGLLRKEVTVNATLKVYQCVGSLIVPGVILTAASCVNNV